MIGANQFRQYPEVGNHQAVYINRAKGGLGDYSVQRFRMASLFLPLNSHGLGRKAGALIKVKTS
jgi:hypothetical protein